MNLSDRQQATNTLLTPQDPPVFEVINPDSQHPLVLVCEHAGQSIPQKLGQLGLSHEELQRHIAWDIGAAAVARKMANALGAPAILQSYSRLVIDCNRPPLEKTSIPEVSDNTSVPGNIDLTHAMKMQRVDEVFTPFHSQVSDILERHERTIILAIHSFTPMLSGETRPWDIAFLYRNDTETSEHFEHSISAEHPELSIGMNQPYIVSDESDWFVPEHGERRNLPHSLIEIRNDHLLNDTEQTTWAQTLCRAVNRYLKDN